MRRALALLLLAGCERPPGAVEPPADLASPADAGPPDLAPPRGSGVLRVTVLDDEQNLPMPARVIVTAVPPTPPARFDRDRTGKPSDGWYGIGISPGVIGAPEGVLLVGGDGWWKMPAGTYDLFVTRGPEWEAEVRRVTIAADRNEAVTVALRHSVDTRGWLAADLHVHTGRSYDAKLQVEDRVVSEVAVGIDLIVTTDHNVLSDLQPQVEQFGYGDIARAIVGDEFNFYEGHGGAYPMPYDRTDPAGGGVVKYGLDWDRVRLIHSGEMFDFIHSFPTMPAVTVNHPYWPDADLGYFTNLKQLGRWGWSPPTPLPDAGRFDAMELLNGYRMTVIDLGGQKVDLLAQLRRDWFFLLNSGARVTALGSSDTHKLDNVRAGFPRTWLRMPTEDVTRVVDADLAVAVKQQRAIASTGPFALLRVQGQEIGGLARPDQNGEVTIDALVDAPGWIDVSVVRLYVNGRLARELPVAAGLRPLLHNVWKQAVPPGDGWIVLEAEGQVPLPTALIGESGGGRVVPYAVTNPVFLDGDGDGMWRPAILERDRDPGPPGPNAGGGGPWFVRPSEPAPLDCEPPLDTDPARWVLP